MTEFTFEYNKMKTKLYYRKEGVLEEVSQDKLIFIVGTTKAAAINKIYDSFISNMNAIYWDSSCKDRTLCAKLTLEIKN